MSFSLCLYNIILSIILRSQWKYANHFIVLHSSFLVFPCLAFFYASFTIFQEAKNKAIGATVRILHVIISFTTSTPRSWNYKFLSSLCSLEI